MPASMLDADRALALHDRNKIDVTFVDVRTKTGKSGKVSGALHIPAVELTSGRIGEVGQSGLPASANQQVLGYGKISVPVLSFSDFAFLSFSRI